MHHLSKDVRAELRYVLIGEIVCSALICVVFALLHRLDYTVPLGAVWGSFFALLNLYLLARRVQRISDSGEADKAAAQKQLKASYLGRIMIMAFAVVTGVLIPSVPLYRSTGAVSGAAANYDDPPRGALRPRAQR